jgi:SOS-response transcriptional repressor LexA
MIACPRCNAPLPLHGRHPAGVTQAQGVTLDYIAKTIINGGLSPTIREIMLATGRNSAGGVHQQIVALKARGFLRRAPRGARPLSLTDMAWAHYTARETAHA